jgi:hypothetical protein
MNNLYVTLFPKEIPKSKFHFINNPEKLNILSQANNKLNLTKNKVVFIYSAPKVGSTSLVSSFRIFAINKLNVVHIHDEVMLKVLANIENITINELILYNKYLGKDVYVINIYRSPIERKISTFFEKIGAYHFNNIDENLNTYNINRVINRFNNIFPHIFSGDHFIDNYNINIPNIFDFNNKFILVNENGIKYITLRLKDAEIWPQILTNIFGFNIRIIKDYESSNKPIKQLYNSFKTNYKIPKNLLEEQIKDTHFCYYYSPQEISQYYNNWLNNSTEPKQSYTIEQYKLYNELTMENSHLDYIQLNHYFDEGCICKACDFKRNKVVFKLMNSNNNLINDTDKIIHNNAKIELIKHKVNKINTINNLVKPMNKTYAGKNFVNEMQNVVKRNN